MTKIMIVEDEAGLRQGLEINLRLENYDTAQAADGEEAIRLFHSEQPDLILLDLMLPKRSGFEVLDHIRKYSKVPGPDQTRSVDARGVGTQSAPQALTERIRSVDVPLQEQRARRAAR